VRGGTIGAPLGMLVALVAVMPLACGRKAPPLAPEDVLPSPITDLTATNVADGIQLAWSRPTRYADGKRMTDLGGFVISRSEGEPPGSPLRRLADLQVTDRDRFRQLKRFRYVDGETTVGVHYRYQVVSYTTDLYFSATSNIVSVQRVAVGEESHAPLPTPQR
jgi:hypothetical protein